MTMMKIYRDINGNCINIGDWDFRLNTTAPTAQQIKNPLPTGAYEEEANVIVGWDGGLYLDSDPKANKL